MTYNSWQLLNPEEQERKCQDLNPYEEWDVFKEVEKEFLREFGNQKGIEKVHCGLGPSMGPLNGIVITIRPGEKKTQTPKKFMGFPVYKEYQKKQKAEPGEACNAEKPSSDERAS